MGQALYRTYRSRSLDEVVGQEHITTALSHSLKNGTISHAYLFTGPKGVGKTSIARILAHEINGIPYDDDSMHLDIIEIDAASNRRIDEIRDLRDKVQIAPSSAKYKVYIIDEVHMLTKEAFNALLKTLEEPPAHVVFILATTESYKLPDTIISRTQRYSFKPIDQDKVIEHLKFIAEKEKIKITDEALGLIALHGDGSFRDSISLLDQARNKDKEVSLSDVQRMLGIAPSELIESIVNAIASNDLVSVSTHLIQMQLQGYEAAQVAKQISEYLRKSLLSGDTPINPSLIMDLLRQLLLVPASPDPKTSLEICLMDAALNRNLPVNRVVSKHVDIQTPKAEPVKQVEPQPLKNEVEAKAEVTEEPKKTATVTAENNFDEDLWPKLLNAIKGHHNTLYGIVRQANPVFGNNEITLELEHNFNKKHIDTAQNKKIISKAIEDLTGQKIIINTVLLKKDGKAEPVEVKKVDDTKNKPNIDNISNIFGGAELLES